MNVLTLQPTAQANFPLQAWLAWDLFATSGLSTDAFGAATNVSGLPDGNHENTRIPFGRPLTDLDGWTRCDIQLGICTRSLVRRRRHQWRKGCEIASPKR